MGVFFYLIPRGKLVGGISLSWREFQIYPQRAIDGGGYVPGIIRYFDYLGLAPPGGMRH